MAILVLNNLEVNGFSRPLGDVDVHRRQGVGVAAFEDTEVYNSQIGGNETRSFRARLAVRLPLRAVEFRDEASRRSRDQGSGPRRFRARAQLALRDLGLGFHALTVRLPTDEQGVVLHRPMATLIHASRIQAAGDSQGMAQASRRHPHRPSARAVRDRERPPALPAERPHEPSKPRGSGPHRTLYATAHPEFLSCGEGR